MRNHRSKCLWENSFGGQPCGIGVWWYILFTRIQFHFIYAIILTDTVWLRSVCKCMLSKQIHRDYFNALSWYKIDCIRCWLCGTDKHFSVWHDYDGCTWVLMSAASVTSQQHSAWRRHQTEIFSALLALCVGNSPVTDEFPSQRPVTRSFEGFLSAPEQTP